MKGTSKLKLNLEDDRLLLLLLLTDAVFLILHLLYIYTSLLPTNFFSMGLDLGYAEFFQYTKEFWIAILFLILGIRRRKFAFYVFSFLFLYLLIDDSLAIHENYGGLLAEYFGFAPVFGLRPIDFGELMVYAYTIGFFALWVGVAYFLSDPATRRDSRRVIFLLVVLFVFGVLADMLEIMIKNEDLSKIIRTIEETGEMVVMSILTWYVYRLKPGGVSRSPDPGSEVQAA